MYSCVLINFSLNWTVWNILFQWNNPPNDLVDWKLFRGRSYKLPKKCSQVLTIAYYDKLCAYGLNHFCDDFTNFIFSFYVHEFISCLFSLLVVVCICVLTSHLFVRFLPYSQFSNTNFKRILLLICHFNFSTVHFKGRRKSYHWLGWLQSKNLVADG